MKTQDVESFPPEVIRKLKTYVYRPIDPRNGETFYIGKGQGNRVTASSPTFELSEAWKGMSSTTRSSESERSVLLISR